MPGNPLTSRPVRWYTGTAIVGSMVLVGCAAPTGEAGGPGAYRPAAPARLVAAQNGRLVYDSTLHVYWLANANLAARQTFGVQGVDSDGSMSWNTAQNWVAAMNAANYLGHDDWRLPPTQVPDTGCTEQTSQGSFAYKCTGSDMGELFYEELGGSPGATVSGLRGGQVGLFRNFQPYLYWSGTPDTRVGKSSWSFSFGNGYEGTNLNINAMYVIPEFPETPVAPLPPPQNLGIGVVPAVSASPSLLPMADGRIVFDRALSVGWLANANLAATETFGVRGINPDGSMNWNTANAWIAAMNAANYLGHSTWRLPKTVEPDSGCSLETPANQEFIAYNCRASEMGELFYAELGSEAGSSLAYTHDRQAILFSNFQQSLYWSEADTAQAGFGGWTFSFGNGFQGTNFFANDLYVIPVVDGIRCLGPRCDPNPPPPGCTGTACQ